MTVENVAEALNATTQPPEPEQVNDQVQTPEDDGLSDAYDKAMAAREPEAKEPGEEPEEAGDRPRGPDGKFVAKEKESLEGDGGAEDEPESSTVAATSSAPEHLPQAIKQGWDDLPQPMRDAISSHQKDMDRKFGELGRAYGEVRPLVERLQEAKKIPALANLSGEQIAKGALELAAVQAELESGDPQKQISVLVQIAQQYGALDGLAKVMQGHQPEQSDQHIQTLNRRIADLENQLKETGNPEYIRKNVSTILEERDTEALVKDLSQDKPYYADVEAHMPAFIQMAWQTMGEEASPKDVFNAAYDMAVNAIPDVREKARAAAEQAAPTPDPKRTESAKKAASINVKSSSNGKDKPLSEEQALAQAYDRAMAG